MELFTSRHGVIPACDVHTLDELEDILRETSHINGIVGYKLGCVLGLTYGLPKLVEVARKYTDTAMIYDHQKAGTDIPQMAPEFIKVCANAGIRGVIIFPQAGPETGAAFIRNTLQSGLIPIIGGEMTHPKYLTSEGGFIRDLAPEEMYILGAKEGASFFVVPGNRIEPIRKYAKILSKLVDSPVFLMPGIGRQGGDMTQSFHATNGCPSYAIIGSAIYMAPDIAGAAAKFCEEALRFEEF